MSSRTLGGRGFLGVLFLTLIGSEAAHAQTAVPRWQHLLRPDSTGERSPGVLAARELADGTVMIVTDSLVAYRYDHDGNPVLSRRPARDSRRVRAPRRSRCLPRPGGLRPSGLRASSPRSTPWRRRPDSARRSRVRRWAHIPRGHRDGPFRRADGEVSLGNLRPLRHGNEPPGLSDGGISRPGRRRPRYGHLVRRGLAHPREPEVRQARRLRSLGDPNSLPPSGPGRLR